MEPLLAREIAGELVAICLNQNDKGEYAPLRQLASATVCLLRHGEAGNEAVRLLLAALKDEDSSVRSAAAGALGTSSEAWQHCWPRSRMMTGWCALRRQGRWDAGQGSAEVVSALLAALTEEDLFVRFAAIRALGMAGQGSAEVVRRCWPRSRMKTGGCALRR